MPLPSWRLRALNFVFGGAVRAVNRGAAADRSLHGSVQDERKKSRHESPGREPALRRQQA